MNIAHHAAFLRKKSQVSQQFSRAAHSYDSAATVQQQALDRLLTLLKPEPAEPHPHLSGNWLDIGCGTGKAFAPLRQAGVQRITGIDLSRNMLGIAASRADHNTRLMMADADALPIADQSCDGILSSLMLQWSQNLHHTLGEWTRALKPGATLAIATLLPGTHIELAQAWASIDDHTHINSFDSLEYVQSTITESGLDIQTLEVATLTQHYQSLSQLLKSLKAIGATNVNPGRHQGLMTRNTLHQLNTCYPKNSQHELPLSYAVCWIIATRRQDRFL